MYVTVRATDNGRPPLDDVCTFKITIVDINDNPPIFDKVKYEQSIPADFPVNKVVMPITSYDFDDGENSIIKYELLTEKDYQYFRIDENNGLIYLARPIDRRPGQYYNLIVRASNIVPDHPQDAQTDVRIKIIESHKKPPIFLDVPSAPIRLQENFTDYSQSLVTLTAMSNVPDKPGVIFELVNGRTEQTNSKKTFVFNQSDDTASISLGKSLDYEEITEYTLTMIVRNTWDSSAEVIVKIKVEDVNVSFTIFSSSLYCKFIMKQLKSKMSTNSVRSLPSVDCPKFMKTSSLGGLRIYADILRKHPHSDRKHVFFLSLSINRTIYLISPKSPVDQSLKMNRPARQ